MRSMHTLLLSMEENNEKEMGSIQVNHNKVIKDVEASEMSL